MPKKVDLTGKRFGRLVVAKDSGMRIFNNIAWECSCDCGNTKVISALNLKTGKTKSCGCLKAESLVKSLEKMSENNKEMILVEGTSLSMLIAKTPKNNSSGVKGVCWGKRAQRWIAHIGFQSNRIYLGYFDNIEDAIKVRKEAEEKYFTPILEKYGRLEVQE